MKYKVLLTGRNKTTIDDFFVQLDDTFESQCSSSRYDDLISHINYFAPDVFVYCMDRESRDTMSRMVSVKNKLSKKGIPFILIGDVEDCEEFTRLTANIADVILQKPIAAKTIQKQIMDFLQELERIEEEIKEKERQAEEERRAQEEARAQEELEQLERQLEEAALAQQSRRKHILVVDDDARMLKVIKEHLHETYDVATAINGKLALKFLETKQTDLVLLDYVMPGMDGPTLLRTIHSNPATKDLPIIFLTGMAEKEKIQEALNEKPQGYLLKPVDREKLLAAVKRIIG
jgi:CheY-like chemotaxis protein